MPDYVVFVGPNDCPDGGWYDFVGRYPTLDEARAAAVEKSGKGWWWHIVHNYEVVEKG